MDVNILKEPLKDINIKTRKEGFGQVGYIEGSHAISEANRAFGYDGWSCNTIETNNVQSEQKEKKRKTSQEPITILNYVGYTAKVRITVGDITRDGFGFGQGIDRDLGKSHESAIKEAETDAIKRALRSFGNIFGLALYTKDSSNIETKADSDYINADVGGAIIKTEDVAKLLVLLKKNNLNAQSIVAEYGINHLAQLTEENYKKILDSLRIKD